jgi:hypothetical protein
LAASSRWGSSLEPGPSIFRRQPQRRLDACESLGDRRPLAGKPTSAQKRETLVKLTVTKPLQPVLGQSWLTPREATEGG